LDIKKQLDLVKYNKQLMSKLDFTLYTYQKRYFNSLITPALLEDKSIFLKSNIFDKKTLDKLYEDFEKDKTGIYEGKELFKKNADKKIYNLFKEPKKSKSVKLPNLIELNLSNLKNIELPCTILQNLESLSLTKISDIKFITNESNISLDKLKYLYLNNISFVNGQKINFKFDNLIYLDLRMIEQEGKGWEEEEKEDAYDYDDDDDDPEALIKIKTFEKLQNYISIFNFDFLSIFLLDDKELNDDKFVVPSDRYLAIKQKFKNPNELFNQKIIKKLNFFNFEISYDLDEISGSYEIGNKFIYKYNFSQTKGDKYLFKTFFETYSYGDDSHAHFIQKEYRICNNINYGDYYFNNKDITIIGYGKEFLEVEDKDFTNINSFIITEKYKNDSCDKEHGNGIEFLFFLKEIKTYNELEMICLDYLDIKYEKTFIDIIIKLKKLKIFSVKIDCLLDNKQLIKLFNNLSKLKHLLKIEISFKKQLKLSAKEKEEIKKLFPDVSIKIAKNNSSIFWTDNNPISKMS
jgi:hypothetical protein